MKSKETVLISAALTVVLLFAAQAFAEAANSGAEWEELCSSGRLDLIREALADLPSRDVEPGTNSPLHVAAEYASDPAVIYLMTDYGLPLSAPGLEGLTPLMIAAAYNPHDDITVALIKAGSQPDARDGYGRTPLHLAAAMDNSTKVIASLLRYGASAAVRDNEGRTPLWLAAARADAGAVELLLDAGAPVDEPDNGGVTPLQMACLLPDAETIQLLIEAGADANRRDEQRYTPVMRAVAAGAGVGVLKALMVGKADLLAEDDRNRSAVFLAVSNPQVSADVAAMLIDAEGTPDTRESGLMTPLMEACRAGNVQAARLLLDKGADPSLGDRNEWTPLMFAVMSNSPQPLINLLTERGASLDSGTRDGITPLMLASRSPAQSDALAALSGAGASVDFQNLQGVTALMVAAAAGNEQGVEKLLSLGASVSVRDIDGMTALFHAMQPQKDNSAVMEMLIKAGAEVDARTPHDTTPLMNAALRDIPWAVEKLLDSGAVAGARDFLGWTPLHFAARSSAAGDGNSNSLSLIMAKSEAVDARDNGGTTPLMVAAASNNAGAVKLLLKAGANPSLTDRTGRSALGYARLRNAKECAALLEVY